MLVSDMLLDSWARSRNKIITTGDGLGAADLPEESVKADFPEDPEMPPPIAFLLDVESCDFKIINNCHLR